jgi:hypothetical protein
MRESLRGKDWRGCVIWNFRFGPPACLSYASHALVEANLSSEQASLHGPDIQLPRNGSSQKLPLRHSSSLIHESLANWVELDPMEPMRELGRMMIFAGAALATAGALVWLAARWGGFPLRLWRLPGDISYQAKHGSFYFPVVTCILLSVALTLVLWLVQWLKR